MKQRNVSIQLIRVCACVMVFLVHFGQRVELNGVIREFTEFGKYGVHLFFLISGFLAGKTFFGSSVNVKGYYVKRIIAIMPLYYLVIAYYFVSENILNRFMPVIPTDELGVGWFRYIFLLNGVLNSDTYFWSNLGITWTIPIFMCFYLIAPWLLRYVKTVPNSIILWGIVFVITKVLSKFYYCNIFNNIHFIFLGVVICVCVSNHKHKQAMIVFSIVSICAIILGSITYTYISIFSCIMLALVTIDDICLPNWCQKSIDVLDKYSYTLYLMHGVVFCSLIDRLKLFGVSNVIIAAIAIVGTIIATWIVGKFIETPIQNYLKRRF